MLRVSLRAQIRKEKIRRRTTVTDIGAGGDIARRTDGLWCLKMLEWRPRNGKRSVGRLPTRWTDNIGSLGAAGNKRPRTVDCGAPYKRPTSVDVNL
ncbi:jg10471 [Pararge aegeria aegeria]|uniref:Jg10471 protein n=1 Tax=Pararge aegeria aegeria TaxID=348720 RepID=A0A8S4RG36_9NEOP|nr:jg10471 [Pararge aegeria aegeria]